MELACTWNSPKILRLVPFTKDRIWTPENKTLPQSIATKLEAHDSLDHFWVYWHQVEFLCIVPKCNCPTSPLVADLQHCSGPNTKKTKQNNLDLDLTLWLILSLFGSGDIQPSHMLSAFISYATKVRYVHKSLQMPYHLISMYLLNISFQICLPHFCLYNHHSSENMAMNNLDSASSALVTSGTVV